MLYAICGSVAFFLSSALSYFILRPPTITEQDLQSAEQLLPPYRMQCPKEQHEQADETFLLLLTGQFHAKYLRDSLCGEIASLGFSLELFWGLDDADRLQRLTEGEPAIVYGRSEVVESAIVSGLQSYQKIARYPFYASKLISSEPIELSRLSLSGKRIGLHQDQSSRSGRLIPISMFRSIGLNSSDYNLVLGSSHRELRRLLENNEVDLIASYWSEEDVSRYPELESLEISSDVDGTNWYIRPDLLGSSFSCIFQRNLIKLASQDDDPYFQQMEIIANDC
jgi:phosphonate transport system substrate-binding protein